MISKRFYQGTMPPDILNDRRRIWETKEILQKLYYRWYGLILDFIRPGVTLELGGGSGNLKEYFPGALCSDVSFVPWLDAVLDAQKLPFKDESIDSLVLFDVLHHLRSPAQFFREAERVLNPEGRIVLMEPYVSWASYFVYRCLHQEGMDGHIEPFDMAFHEEVKEPFRGNQAIPTLIFEKYRKKFDAAFPRLTVIREEKIDTLLYPLSGGFHSTSLCPMALYGFFEKVEKVFHRFNRFLAFRLLIVVEKRPDHGTP
jgi:SAM-dependent methyltransferase